MKPPAPDRPRSTPRNICVLAHHGYPFIAARLVEGIADYGRRHGYWKVHIRALEKANLARQLRANPAEGFIMQAASWTGEVLGRFDRPVVLLHANDWPALKAPAVNHDELAIGRMAAEHFLERGFRHFAYGGFDTLISRERERGFCEALAQAGHACITMASAVPGTDPDRRPGWRLFEGGLLMDTWVRALPPGTAVLGFNDEIALLVIESALLQGREVPDDLAVLGVDDNDLQCEYAAVSMSSVDPDIKRLGFEAAKLLDGLMHGQPPPKAAVVIPPRAVVARSSTQRLAFRDPDVAAAVRLIRERADLGDEVSVQDLLKLVNVSRTTLEQRFRRALGRAPGEEIRHARLVRARELVLETDLSLLDVTVRCGFNSLSYFSQAFKREFGVSPSDYRKQHRAG